MSQNEKGARDHQMNTRWFGVTWMRSTAPPRVLFLWVRFGRKRKLDLEAPWVA